MNKQLDNKMIVKTKLTGTYFSSRFGHNFCSMDKNKAIIFDDTVINRNWFKRNYRFELEFINV